MNHVPAPDASNRLDVPPGDPGRPGAAWDRVSPRYVIIVLIRSVIVGLVLLAVAALIWLIVGWSAGWSWGWSLLAVAAVIGIITVLWAPRRARAIGYRMRDDDLLIRRGIAWLRFVSVPYGRMQLIDISRGPLDRAVGLSELRFVTAAAASNVRIPGLPEAEAVELRDRLTALAETRRAGL